MLFEIVTNSGLMGGGLEFVSTDDVRAEMRSERNLWKRALGASSVTVVVFTVSTVEVGPVD
jgi:hypothetical protein